MLKPFSAAFTLTVQEQQCLQRAVDHFWLNKGSWLPSVDFHLFLQLKHPLVHQNLTNTLFPKGLKLF